MPSPSGRKQDTTLDPCIAVDKITNNAPSLHPNEPLAFACATGNRMAIAIRDSWKFSFPVTVMDPDEFDRLIARSTTTFSARGSERPEL